MNLKDFMTRMDKNTLRAIGVTVGMFVLVMAMIVLGRRYFGLSEDALENLFGAVAGSVWALPVTILVFVAAAFIGAPQWLLITGAVIAFGPVQGFAYSWIATMISASGNFWLGRTVGAERVARYGGDMVSRMVKLVRKNGFVTSFTVRLVPTGPFVLVNMAAGVSGMTFLAFLSGTALGVIPKTAAIAFLGQGLLGALGGNIWLFALCVLAAIGVIVAVMLFARTRLKRREGEVAAGREEPER